MLGTGAAHILLQRAITLSGCEATKARAGRTEPHAVKGMKSTEAMNTVVDLRAYRKNLQKSNLCPPRMTTQSSGVSDTAPAYKRIEFRVELDNLARTLLAVRKWLTDHDCSHQVFHCVRTGREAVISVEFDPPCSGLFEKFCVPS